MESTTLDPKLLMPVLFGALIAFGVYRRVRRNIGRQPLSPARLTSRIAMFSIIGGLILLMSFRDMNLLGAMLGGIAAGAALGWFGLRHTQFEATAQGQFYTPHTYVGALVSALFLGRIAYRFIVLYSTSHALAAADQNPFAAYQKSPLTLAIFGILVGYYVFYYAGVLRRGRGLQPPPGDSTLHA
jgi:hypothetical protein